MSIIKGLRICRYQITVNRIAVQTVEETTWCALSEQDGKKEMGYAPAKLEERAITETVFEQTVDTLDLKAVVCAVNGISNFDQKQDGDA